MLTKCTNYRHACSLTPAAGQINTSAASLHRPGLARAQGPAALAGGLGKAALELAGGPCCPQEGPAAGDSQLGQVVASMQDPV